MTWNPPPPRATGHELDAANDWNPVVEALAHLERVHREQFTAPVTISEQALGTAHLVVSLGELELEAIPYLVVFSSPTVIREQVAATAPTLRIVLCDGGVGTPVARIAEYRAPSTNPFQAACRVEYELPAPTAGPHTYQIRAYTSNADDWTIGAGLGAGDVLAPGFVELWRVAA